MQKITGHIQGKQRKKVNKQTINARYSLRLRYFLK